MEASVIARASGEPSAFAPSVSVVVPAYNAEDTLPACLDALKKMSYPASEIIVFSDGSTDRTVEIAETSGATVIQNTERSRGPGHGRNVGARHATSQLLLFVDADVVVEQDCLELLVSDLLEHDAAAVFGSYNNRPAATRLAGLYANLRHHFVHQNSARDATTFWTGLGLMRREVFLELNGFDEKQFAHPSIEDVELGMRIKALGHTIRLVPEAQATHCKDWTLWRVWHTDVVRRALPWSRLLVSGKADGVDLNLSTKERVKALVSAATFASLLAALFEPLLLLATLVLFATYVYLNRDFVRMLSRNLSTGRWMRATLLHLAYHTYSLGAYAWVVAGSTIRAAFGASSDDREGYAARFDWSFLSCCAALTGLFSWILFYHGNPAYFPDTAAYLSGGEKIFDRGLGLFASDPAAGAGGGDGRAGGGEDGPRAVRSIPYYVLTYVLSAPNKTLLLLGLFHSAIAAFYVVTHCRLENLRPLAIIVIGVGLALLSPVALVTAFAMPDIFAVPIIGGIVLLATSFRQMAPALRMVMILVTGLGVSTHVSFPPLALAVTGAALLWLAWSNRVALNNALPAALVAGLPLVLGVTATVVGGIAGFGEASVAPKRIPLVLARSMSDGPGRWYLAEHCPTKRYAVCEIFPDNRFPEELGPILFQEGGIMKVATQSQLDRIREEEPEIVLNAIRAYPMFQVEKTLSSIAEQFVTFHPIDIDFNRRIYTDAEGTLRVTPPVRQHSSAVNMVDGLSHVFVALSALLLVLMLPLMRRGKLPVVLLCAIGIAANMAICATFSAVAARYGIRVLWMVPLLAALYACAPAWGIVRNLVGGRQPAAIRLHKQVPSD